jgi:hypothetical protein
MPLTDRSTPDLLPSAHGLLLAHLQPTFTFYKGPQKIDTFSGARLDLLKETIAKNA